MPDVDRSWLGAVLLATAGLYLLATVALLGIDGNISPAKVSDASFRAIAARSAGFEVQPILESGQPTRFVAFGLLLVGGSPGGAAGGMQTLLVASVLVVALGKWKRRRFPEGAGPLPGPLSGQRLGEPGPLRWADVIAPAATRVIVLMLGTTAAATALLVLVESYPTFVLLFESASATCSNGLSLRAGRLTGMGQVVLMTAMLIGRGGSIWLLWRIWEKSLSAPLS